MQDNTLKTVLAVVGVVVLILALPVVVRMVRGNTAAAVAATAPAPASPGYTPVPAPPAAPPVPGGMPQAPAYPAPVAAGAPTLDANSLVGTMWEVNSPYGRISVTLNPGGQLIASHPMVGNIPGTWSVQGNNVVANATAMGRDLTIACQIQGNQLFVNGQPIRRLR
ncbi:MAG TPA: hypothetical protein PLO53_05365 [Candidatus Hydrogenedentes bacterium]|nr:hypothetical protein [Candidatus Hydrogenedentota bacterium]